MIQLHQFKPAWGLPNASPFCMKVETYLRMAQIPYEIIWTSDTRKAPKGKLPYIKEGAKKIGDSTLIIEYLKKKYGDKLDQHLSSEEQAIALAFQRLLEENYYWAALSIRWRVAANFQKITGAFFGFLPPILREGVAYFIRRTLLNQAYQQGVGRHSLEEIGQIGIHDLTAVSNFLGKKKFFMGDQPTSIDATVYAFLANTLHAPIDSPMKRAAQKMQNLEAYCQRMKKRFYAE